MTTSPQSGLTLDRWLAWFETVHPKRIDLRLDRFIAVLDTLGLRAPPYKVVTVAGTNGKGSCVAMLESIYWHAGYTVGTFTSPHLWRFNERIRIDGVDAADSELVEVFEDVARALGTVTLSYFEASFVAALAVFRRHDPDVVILEVGMGGRLDATNALDTDCAMIVSIDLDHREWLGETRAVIGVEKAGIVRSGKPVVIGDRTVPHSVLAHAAAESAIPYLIGRDFDFRRDGWTLAQNARPGHGAVVSFAAFRRRRAVRERCFVRRRGRLAGRVFAGHGRGAGGGHRECVLARPPGAARRRRRRMGIRRGPQSCCGCGARGVRAAPAGRRPPMGRVRRHARQGFGGRGAAVRADGRRLVRSAGEHGSWRDRRGARHAARKSRRRAHQSWPTTS